MVIEDKEPVCRLYGSLLQYADYHPVLAYTGEDGILAALVNRPDLVILDIAPWNFRTRGIPKLRVPGVLPGTPLVIGSAVRLEEAEAAFQAFTPSYLDQTLRCRLAACCNP